jgi:hypothetical protein
VVDRISNAHLGQHGVSSQLGQLGTPQSNGQDPLGRDPVGVDVLQRFTGGETLGGLERTDKDPVRGEKVGDGGTLGQELGVGEDVESTTGLGVGLEDGPHGPDGKRNRTNQLVFQHAKRELKLTHSAVLQGTVDFSTTILEEVETSAILRVASSM